MRTKSKMLHGFAFVPTIRYNKENKQIETKSDDTGRKDEQT